MANRYCLNCGEPLTPGLKRCPVCGAKIDDNAAGNNRSKTTSAEVHFPDDPQTGSYKNKMNQNDSLKLHIFNDDPSGNGDTNSMDYHINLDESGDLTQVVERPQLSIQEDDDTEENEVSVKERSRSSGKHAKKESEKASGKKSDRKEKKKEKKKRQVEESYDEYDEDEYDDYDDDYDENPHTGLIIFLIIIIILLLAFSALFFFKPEWLDRGFSLIGVNTHFSTSTEISDDEPAATPIATTTPTIIADTSENSATLGTLYVNVDTINIRNGAGTAYEQVGTANRGETYTAYESIEADGYIWYRIGDNQWIADGGGEWVTLS